MCPYGEPPEIEAESDTEWTINGKHRTQADPHLCQAIIVSSVACTDCPLNPGPPPQPSAYCQFIFEIYEFTEAGARFDFGELPLLDWRALALLRRKQREKEIKSLKESSKHGSQ